ncbi:hypothetical protein, partial [Clostridium butyricum]
MAIQISEDKLSPEAKEALRNAKSKSQLLRDALEAYVRNMDVSATITKNNNLANDIKDIKDMLLKISEGSIQITKDNIRTEDIKQYKAHEINKNIEVKEAIEEKKIEVKKSDERTEVKNKVINENKDTEPKKVIEPIKEKKN